MPPLNNDVAGVINQELVIAVAATKRVRTRAAVKNVIAVPSVYRVIP